DADGLQHSGRVVYHAGREQRRQKRSRYGNLRAPDPSTDMEDQDHRQHSKDKTDQPQEHDIDRAGYRKNDHHQNGVKDSPKVVESLQIPEPGASRRAEADLLGQVGDLPVVPDVVVNTKARVLRIRENEEI